jgi:hypothetical protein
MWRMTALSFGIIVAGKVYVSVGLRWPLASAKTPGLFFYFLLP